MVCCALISIVLAALVWPLRYLFRMVRPAKTPPLMWQLAGVENPQNAVPRFSISARLESVGYALSGLGFVIRNEHNARIHIATAIAVMALGTYFQISGSDWIILILAIISVLFAETINTAFEYLCDVVSPQKNEAVKHAKDIAAGAVLITAIGAVIIGAIVLLPYIISEFGIGVEYVGVLDMAASSYASDQPE